MNGSNNLIKKKFEIESQKLLKQLQNSSDDHLILYQLGMLYYERGMSFFWAFYPDFSSESIKFLEKAKEYFERSCSISDDWAPSYSELGLVLFRLKSFDLARENIAKAIQLDPNYARAYVNQGAMIFNAGNPSKAKELFERALEIDKNLAIALNNLGNCYMVQKDYDNAIRNYNKAVELDPYLIQSWNALANANDKIDDKEKAITYYKRSLQLIESLSVLKTIAQLYYESKKLNEAKETYQRILSLNPSDTQAQFNLSTIANQLGETSPYDKLKENIKNE